ncbi:MAG: protein-export chaperone SecB [Hyphomicrobiaceae bacterium]
MADGKNRADGKNGNGAVDTSNRAPTPVQAQVLGQYIRDLSFENPNVDKLMGGPGDNPHIQLEVNVDAKAVDPKQGVFESSINFHAKATSKIGTIYDLEVVYAGLFKIQNIPEQAIEPFLLINCPSILFPFLRRLLADITREGGFPPLLLDPIDFGGLYMRRQQELAASGGKADA